MKLLKIISIVTVLLSINNTLGQSTNESTKFEIKMPDHVFLKAEKEISTSYEIKDENSRTYFMIREVFNIPKNISSSKEFANWYNKDVITVTPDFRNSQETTISNEKAFQIIILDEYSFSNKTYLKLGSNGYIFEYVVINSESKEIKQSTYKKYYKDYEKFINNIKINLIVRNH